jgi:pimeloyl-ACP methyl ester carboxylesterase
VVPAAAAPASLPVDASDPAPEIVPDGPRPGPAVGPAWADASAVEDGGADTGGDAAAAELPEGPLALPVEGFGAAVVVPPAPSVPLPAPPIVILHGNFDRPEWECGKWAPVAAAHGWLLCPRGSPRTDVAAELDRWTWESAEAASREVGAASRALGEAWPGLVREDGALLVGFSLGARHAPAAAAAAGSRFAALVLVEQGFAVTSAVVRAACDAGVARVVYVCGERTECSTRAGRASALWRRAGAEVEVLVMDGVGHAYPEEFDPLAERVFEALAAP